MIGRMQAKKIKGKRVVCSICGEDLTARSLQSHLETQHNVFSHIALSPDLIDEDYDTIVYLSAMNLSKGVYSYPAPNCQGDAGTKYGMRRPFAYLPPHDLVALPGKGRYPKCERCKMQVNRTAWGHRETKTCNRMRAVMLQRKVVSDSAKALNVKFYAYRNELERVEIFRYLGRLIDQNGDDTRRRVIAFKRREASGRGFLRLCGRKTPPR